MSNEIDDFFSSGTGGAPSFKFAGIGDGVRGTVTDMLLTQQTAYGDPDTKLFFKDGSPRMQLNVTLQTKFRNWDKVAKVPTGEDGKEKPGSEDDGTRRIYVKADMLRAVKEALKEHSLTSPAKGDDLAVKLAGTKDVGKGNDQNLFEAKYWVNEKADQAAGDFFADEKQDQAAAPAKEAAPATKAEVVDEPPF